MGGGGESMGPIPLMAQTVGQGYSETLAKEKLALYRRGDPCPVSPGPTQLQGGAPAVLSPALWLSRGLLRC